MLPEPSESLLKWATLLGGLGTAVAAAFALVAVPLVAWQIAENRRSAAATQFVEAFRQLPDVFIKARDLVQNYEKRKSPTYEVDLRLCVGTISHCVMLLRAALQQDEQQFLWEAGFLKREVAHLWFSTRLRFEKHEFAPPDPLTETHLKFEDAEGEYLGLWWIEICVRDDVLPRLEELLAWLVNLAPSPNESGAVKAFAMFKRAGALV